MLSLTSSWKLTHEITCVNFGRDGFLAGDINGDACFVGEDGVVSNFKGENRLAAWFVAESSIGTIDGSVYRLQRAKDENIESKELLIKQNPFSTRSSLGDGGTMFFIEADGTLFKSLVSSPADKLAWCKLTFPLPASFVTCDLGKNVLVAAQSTDEVAIFLCPRDGQSQPLFVVPRAQSAIRSVSFQKQTPIIAVADDLGLIRVFDAEHGSPLRSFSAAQAETVESAVLSCAFSPNGDSRLAVLTKDGLRIWNWQRGTLLHHFATPDGFIPSLHWDAEGEELLLSAGPHLFHFTVPPPKN